MTLFFEERGNVKRQISVQIYFLRTETETIVTMGLSFAEYQ
jgi:hypothetical protein